MYALYHKELYIIPEPKTKNRTCQTWRGKQIALCEDKKELEKLIPENQKERYYIESMAF